jgi:hypothetical protein
MNLSNEVITNISNTMEVDRIKEHLGTLPSKSTRIPKQGSRGEAFSNELFFIRLVPEMIGEMFLVKDLLPLI